MLRSAILLAALILPTIAIAQSQTTQTGEATTQSRDASSAATGQRQDTPFPNMMNTWEYSTQEWR